MKLKCQLTGANCPPYSHNGEFKINDTSITCLLPDLRRCANCIAFAPPTLPNFRDDLLQIASMVLIEKGPMFNPTHKSGASFGSFIRPRICGSLMYAKRKELKHKARECPESLMDSDSKGDNNVNGNKYLDLISDTPDVSAEYFVDELIWEISVANFKRVLPTILEKLTERERQVFNCICEDMPKHEIARILELSPPRISQLTQNLEKKLRESCQRLGLIE